MRKKETIITLMLLIGALLCLFLFRSLYSTHKMIVIKDASGTVLLEAELDRDGYYTVEGKVGSFHLEVKDGTYRAVDVDCPNHDCEKVGAVSVKDYRPIICLPNGIIVELQDE